MNKANILADRIKIAFGITLLVALTGCIGVVGGGYGGGVVVADPDVYVFGGGYDRGGDVHGYSNRGSESREVAHGGVHAGGGGGGHGGGHH